jgi:hypothetical protein
MRFFWIFLVAGALSGGAYAASSDEMPPLPPSPVQSFREWLQMNQAQRQHALEDWPSEKREVLMRKLKVYEQLNPAERERRLRMVELRFYMQPLMTNTPAARAEGLKKVPPGLRRVIVERLRKWDSIPSATQAKILANEAAVNYFASLPPAPPGVVIRSTNPSQEQEQREHLKFWQTLSRGEREKLSAQFNDFFELPREERVRALSRLTDEEREEMQETLEAFAKLSPEQRTLCIESFNKFTQMSPNERNAFLRNAARWEAMTPEERASWKSIVRELPPLPPVEMPPFPPTSEAKQIAGTNGP